MSHALRRKARTHAGAKSEFPDVSDKRRLTLQYENKLVLLTVPMQKRRLAAWGQLG